MIPSPDRNPGILRRWVLPGAAIALVMAFYFSPISEAIDYSFFDTQSRHPVFTPKLQGDSAIVLVDEDTMAELGRKLPTMRWPFPRPVFAGLVAALDRAGASRIVMDFTFFERMNESEQDLLLAGVAAEVRSTVLAATPGRGPVFWDQKFRDDHPGLFPEARTGDVTLNPDSDGVSRRYRVEGSLAAAASRSPARVSGEKLLRWHGGIEQLKQDPAHKIPVLSATQFMVRGWEIINRVSAASPNVATAEMALALANEPRLEDKIFQKVKGKTVFVGASASSTYDLKSTPVGRTEPGVLIHWTAWTNLADGNFITPFSRLWSLVAGFVAAGLILYTAITRPGLAYAGVVALSLVLGVAAGSYVGISLGWFFGPSTPLVAAMMTLLGVSAENFWRERQRKLEIQAMFGSYVAPSVVEQLVRDPNAIRLGGEKREATVFFCDLAGFTDLSEKIPPEVLLTIINRYLEEVSDCLLAQGAYIDKYIGDAVMAVFGVPQPLSNHALAACHGALEAQRVFRKFSDDVAEQHGHRPHMRIGINTGEMIVGNLGSDRKKNYTVLGDPVNLASRLEGANKEFGTSIMLGESTARRVQEYLVTRPLTRLRVKGKTEAIEVHELVGAPNDLDPTRQAFIAAYREGYRLYGGRQFPAAAEAFRQANALIPGDRVTLALIAHATEYSTRPPAPDWQPILTLDSK